MSQESNYLEINRKTWNDKTPHHFDSDFYDVEGFLKGKSSLNAIELNLLKDITNKEVLHLQCHFGLDTLSLARMGAKVTGIDLSDTAIEYANKLKYTSGTNATFLVSDIYSLPLYLEQKFDVVYTSYGTIGWLPDLEKWANVIAHFLKPGGKFIFAEFHPVVWMFNDDFTNVGYNYFKADPIIETEEGTYANREADLKATSVSWNHSISEVVNSLIQAGLSIDLLNEYNYSPYNCFRHTKEIEKGKFIIEHFGPNIPMVYAIAATKK